MPAPLAKGLIIAASVIVAAGIAIYESPQVRQWVDQSRRKIAVALHSLGDDTQPRRPSESSNDFEARRRRDELVRKNRNDMIRRARDEGIAVDLDELSKIGSENTERAGRKSRSDRAKSFDDLVGSDGMLKATGKDGPSNSQLRMRGPAGFAAGSAAAAAITNPFSDDDNLLFDVGGGDDDDDDDDEAPSPKPFAYIENATCESSTTIKAEPASPLAPLSDADLALNSESSTLSGPCMNSADLEAVQSSTSPLPSPLIDLAPESQPETQQPSAAPSEVADDADADADADAATQSFYSFTSSASHPQDLAQTQYFDNYADHLSTGTLTPPSHRSNSSVHSVVDSHADDIAVLSMQNDLDHDARSDVFSDAGWTDAGVSEAGDRTGVMTPNSWTDVGSDDESEWGGQGHVSQVHQ